MTQHSAPEPGSLSASLGGDDARTTVLDLDALKALCAAAQALPWVAYFTTHGDPMILPASRPTWPTERIADVSTSPGDYGRANCLYLAAAASAVPALIAEVVRLKSLLVEFESVRSSLPQDPEDSTTNDLARNLAALADALENDANESDSSAFVAYAYQRAAQGIRDLLPVVESCPPVPTKET